MKIDARTAASLRHLPPTESKPLETRLRLGKWTSAKYFGFLHVNHQWWYNKYIWTIKTIWLNGPHITLHLHRDIPNSELTATLIANDFIQEMEL